MQQVRLAARAAGYASLGFAAGGFMAPDLVARVAGYGDRRGLVLALAARDLVVGLGLVTAERVTPWLWARFAAEVMDTVLHAAGAATGAFDRKKAVAISAGAAACAAVEYAVLAGDPRDRWPNAPRRPPAARGS